MASGYEAQDAIRGGDVMSDADESTSAGIREVVAQWGRIGCTGFGGPPAHIALLRDLCVDRRGWLTATEFEDAVATCNLLPGPASTQLAIFCAWRVAGPIGAVVGGAAFILPGLAAILALAIVFLGSPPDWIRGAGAGAGAAVAAVAVHAGFRLVPESWRRSPAHWRWIAYAALGGVAAATLGPRLVLVLIGCGVVEVALRYVERGRSFGVHAWPIAVAAAPTTGGLLALVWVAFKVGALAYGGGFVIIPLMQADAVDAYHWMTNTEFLNAVALGQITPGPVTQTVAVVGYAAYGVGGGLLAALVAFAPSFSFVLLGAKRFDTLRHNTAIRAFLDGAGPAAVGAIIGVAIPLAFALDEAWQYAVLAAAAVSLLVLRRGVVLTLILAGAVGVVAEVVGAPLP
jgi:chromate transporter